MTHAKNPQHDTQLYTMLLYLIEKVESLSSLAEDEPRIYDNKSLMALLGIKDRYLKRLCDNGLLGYSRHGDKYWYTQSDIYKFLSRTHFAPFGQ